MQKSSLLFSSSSNPTQSSSLLPQYEPGNGSLRAVIPAPVTTRPTGNRVRVQHLESRSRSRSRLSEPSAGTGTGITPATSLTLLHARASRLQGLLQTLLDAQAAALVPAGTAGAGGAFGGWDDGSEGSYTPTTGVSSRLSTGEGQRKKRESATESSCC